MAAGRPAEGLERRILQVIRAGARAQLPDAAFNRLALDVFAFQYGANEPYRRFCDLRGQTPRTVSDWREAPAVPAAAFKEVALSCFPSEQAALYFTTSGTTRGERQGTHYLLTAHLYNASLLAQFETALLPDGTRLPAYVLAQSPNDLPHSSLSHMFGEIERRFAMDSTYYVDEKGLDFAALDRDLALAEAEGNPIMLLGTAFAFVHFLDYCREQGRSFLVAEAQSADGYRWL